MEAAKHTIRLNYKRAYIAKRPLLLSQLSEMLKIANTSTRQLLHMRLTIIFIAVGCIRTGAASVIQVHYNVTHGRVTFDETSHVSISQCPETKIRYIHVKVLADKNRNPSMPTREVFLPEYISALDLHPVRDLLQYIVEHRPASTNRFLLALPHANGNWSSYKPNKHGVTVGFKPNKKLREIVARAYPSMSPEEIKSFGTTSLRKCLAQTLMDDGWPETVILDMGGWSRGKHTLNSYQTTPLSIRLIVLTNLGKRLGPSYYARA